MGLLNRFFGGKKSTTDEILADIEFCRSAWINYINSYSSKEESAKNLLTPRGREGMVVNSADFVMNAVQEIENQIPKELIDIKEEEKKERDVIKNLKKLTTRTASRQTFQLIEAIADKDKIIAATYSILEKLAEILKAELHAIKQIKQNPTNNDIVLGLYKLIISEEYHLLSFFRNRLSKRAYQKELELLQRILTGEEVAKEIETEEERLVKKFKDIMVNVDSEHELRVLALDIYEELKKEVDYLENPKAGEEIKVLVYDDRILTEVIKEFHKKYSEEKVKAIIKAFRYAYEQAVLF